MKSPEGDSVDDRSGPKVERASSDEVFDRKMCDRVIKRGKISEMNFQNLPNFPSQILWIFHRTRPWPTKCYRRDFGVKIRRNGSRSRARLKTENRSQ